MGSSAVDDHAASKPGPTALAGMACLDTSGNPRIPLLMELVGALSRATDPDDVLLTFASGLEKLQGRSGYVSLSTRDLAPGEYRITRFMRKADPLHMMAGDVWSRIDEIPIHRGGLFGEIIRSAYPEVILHLDVRDDPVVGDDLAEFGSMMAIPLYDDGEPKNWSITLRRDPEGFTMHDLEETILQSNLVGGTVKNTVLTRELRRANARIQREVDEIGRIQQAMLPSRIPEVPGLSIAASFETFDVAGGDIYDIEKLGADDQPDAERPWAFLVADAAGHGPAAATVIAMLNAIISAAPASHSVGEVLEFANRHLHAKGIDGTFVTAILARYDPVDRALTWSRAGHPPPILMCAGDGMRIERIDAAGGLPLGVIDDATYESETVRLEPGHTVVMYSDGVTEAFDPAGEMFGVKGIERCLTDCTGDPECAISHIRSALIAHEAGRRPNDDQTILALKAV